MDGRFARNAVLTRQIWQDAVKYIAGAVNHSTCIHEEQLWQVVAEFRKLQRAMSSSEYVEQCCCICMENKDIFGFVLTNPCSHRYCFQCFDSHVKEKLEKNEAFIACPHPGCKDGTLGPKMCQRYITSDMFYKWSNLLSKDKFNCPYGDCSAFLITDSLKNKEECPQCDRLVCVKCKSAWHPQLSCEDFQKLGNDERDAEDLMLMELAKKQGWKRCPFCRFYVEKVSGCLSLKCRCGHVFCYNCGTTMMGDHYCAACGH